MIPIKQEVLDWLMEEDNPPVRYLTIKHLLKVSDSHVPRVLGAKSNIMNYHPVNVILDNRSLFLPGTAQKYKPYKKYQGLYWQIIFLGDFLASADDERVRECCEAVLKLQQDNGGYQAVPPWRGKDWIVCLSGNVLRGLITMGYAEHQNVKKGLDYIAQRIIKNNGIPCTVMEYSIYDTCYMTVPRTLRTFASVPEHLRTDSIQKAMRILIEKEYTNHIYKYVISNARQYHEAYMAYTKNKGTKTTAEERKIFKRDFRSNNPGKPGQEKKGWKRFAFPLHYNTNILEAVVALIEAGDIRKGGLSEAVQIILNKKQEDDRWRMDESLNGKMYADIEQKGKPSKWITFYALYVLNTIEGVVFHDKN